MNDFPWTGKENDPYHPPPSPQMDEESQRRDYDNESGSGDGNDPGCLGCLLSPLVVLTFFLMCWSLVFGFTINDRHFTFGLGCEEGFSIQEKD